MTGKLKDRIKQTKPFANVETEAYLNLVMLLHDLNDAVARCLRGTHMSMPQYNALRILRGAGEEGLTCGDVAKRMVHRVPDVTRLLDRLETQGWVARQRETGDRRVVRVRITKEGLAALAPLDKPLNDVHRHQLGHLGERKLTQLIGLLEEARDGH